MEQKSVPHFFTSCPYNFHTIAAVMAKTKQPTSTPASPSPHQTRSKSPRKEVIATVRRTSPRAKKKTEKLLQDEEPETKDADIDEVPPPSSVAAAPPPIVGSARPKKKVGLPLPSKGSGYARSSSIVAKRPLVADPAHQIAPSTELHPSNDADIGKSSAADVGKPSAADSGKPSAADTGTVPRPRSSSIDANHLTSTVSGVSSLVGSARGLSPHPTSTSGGPLSNDYMEFVATAYLSKKPKLAHSSSVTMNVSTNLSVPRLAQATAFQETSSVPSAKVPSTNDDASLSDDEDKEAEFKEDKVSEKKNFHEQEDILLCMAWVNHTSNAITGTDQDSNEFWSTVYTLFRNAYVEFNLESIFKLGSLASRKRNEAGLRNRFMKTLHPRCKKFTGVYDTVAARAKTGNLTETDIMKESLQLFQLKNGGKKFSHMECWKILQHCPAFVSPRATFSAIKKAKSRKETVIVDDEDESIKLDGAVPNAYDSTALVGTIYGRDKPKRMEKLEKEKESREARDSKLISMFHEQGKEIKSFAKLLGGRAS
jgi:hypothetical protein